ncbi:MAG: hypothetical protein UEP57_01645 [Oscillospiraceae bacterium]|nr:hypothetical protein [Oscillospiraceae bacterium]
MAVNLKQYLYSKGTDAALDAEFASAEAYGRVKPGKSAIFWKSGLRWYVISLDSVQRIFRRVEPVYGKLCCGRKTFIIERLVLILKDGTEVELYIGDDLERQAKALLESLKSAHPGIAYGKG